MSKSFITIVKKLYHIYGKALAHLSKNYFVVNYQG